MSDKFCLQWDDFSENIKKSFRDLRQDSDFADVTLVCEDGHQIEAHKVILASASTFFKTILANYRHSHPLIYMRGVKSPDLGPMIDFLYFGEANVSQENLESFLAIASELEVQGLRRSLDDNDADYSNIKDVEPETKPFAKAALKDSKLKIYQQDHPKLQIYHQQDQSQQGTEGAESEESRTSDGFENVAKEEYEKNLLHPEFTGDLQKLDRDVKLMMGTSENFFKKGQNGTVHGKICKVCGKEGQATDVMRHIEAHHVEGISIPCKFCDRTFR